MASSHEERDEYDFDGNGASGSRKRRRGQQACTLCRRRKVKCSGTWPCQQCQSANADCSYVDEEPTKAKNDLILEGIERIEASLSQVQKAVGAGYPDPLTQWTVLAKPKDAPPRCARRDSSNRGQNTHRHDDRYSLDDLDRDDSAPQKDVWDNAVLSTKHQSSMEAILQWKSLEAFSSSAEPVPQMFQLEQSRTPHQSLCTSPSDLEELVGLDLRGLVQSYRATFGFYYPTLSTADNDTDLLWDIRQASYSSADCRMLLVLALGSAGEVVKSLPLAGGSGSLNDAEASKTTALRLFGVFWTHSQILQSEITVETTQCLLLTALSFAYLQRPLQAWSYISMAATRCKVLLSNSSNVSGHELESLRRIFWSCYILESDYIAELAALPQCGIGEIESTIPLPANYATQEDPEQQELSSLYFLACISIRRLLNRVHDSLYAPKTGIGLDSSRFPALVEELNHQLDEWRDCLPPAFSFSLDNHETPMQYGGFLRQRYLTCRSVIYRPYLARALQVTLDTNTLQGAKNCLEACIMHITNLRAFKHTVLLDTWICSLSMASAMLILLAASQVNQLQGYLRPRVQGISKHLTTMLDVWAHLPDDKSVSPSVQISLDTIKQAGSAIEEHFNND